MTAAASATAPADTSFEGGRAEDDNQGAEALEAPVGSPPLRSHEAGSGDGDPGVEELKGGCCGQGVYRR